MDIPTLIILINQTLVPGGLTSALQLKTILLNLVSIVENIDPSSSSITIDGRTFTRLIKHPTNNNPANVKVVEHNDMVIDGWWDDNEYWGKARFIGASTNVKTDWQRLDVIEEIPVI